MLRIYRIEHVVRKSTPDDEKESRHYLGAYSARHEVLDSNQANDICGLPSPNIGNWWPRDYKTVFAFQSLEALLKYFTPEILEAFSVHGFVIAVYEVNMSEAYLDDIGLQCAIYPNRAKRIMRKYYRGEQTLLKLAA